MGVYKHIIALSICFSITYPSFASGGEKRNSRSQYIEKWKNVAIENMEKFGIPASITLAQGILESGDGNSMLAREANNHFGIKCHGWKGKKVYKDDDKKNECFRKYKSAAESYSDHSQFLQKQRYQFLFELDRKDYKAWAKGLKKAGYATNPKYPQLLIRIIEDNKLWKYDSKSEELLASTKKENKKEIAKTNKKASTAEEKIQFETSNLQTGLHSNRIKYVIAKKGDDPKKIAKNLDLGEWQIKRYNDIKGAKKFEEGEIVFIQPKRNKAQSDHHIVEHAETLWGISQMHGIKLKKLAKYNNLDVGDKVIPGMKLWLKKPPDE